MKICIPTGTRADWGLLRPLAARLRSLPGADIQVVPANMHLDSRFGHTLDEILADGFVPAASVPMDERGDSPAARVRAMSQALAGFGNAFEALKPDMLVALGDRYEMLSAAEAAVLQGIPVCHIAGGEISEGAIDDCLRHAITKLSHLHLTATEDYRRRVIQMGESPDRVFNVGAIGVANFKSMVPMTLEELEQSLNMPLAGRTIAIVTYHPATLDPRPHSVLTQNLLDALDRTIDAVPDFAAVITYPNNDAGGAAAIPLLKNYAADRPQNVRIIPSLGARRYLSLLHYAAAVVGNSSSGIVEVPSAGIPTVDIGIRQTGRTAADSVLHCDTDTDSIYRAIVHALSPEMRRMAAKTANPYDGSDTAAKMTDIIVDFLSRPVAPKKFYNLP